MKKWRSFVGPKTLFVSILVVSAAGLYVTLRPEIVDVVYREMYTYASPVLQFLPPPRVEETVVVQEVDVELGVDKPPVISRLERLIDEGIITPVPRPSLKSLLPAGGVPVIKSQRELYRLIHGCTLHGISEVSFEFKGKAPMNMCRRAEQSVYGQSHIFSNSEGKSGKENWVLFLNDFSRLMQVVYGVVDKDDSHWVHLTPDELKTLEMALDWLQAAGINREGMNDREKAKLIHDEMAKRITYHDLNAAESVFYQNRNKFISYALLQKDAICEGYAQTYGFLLSLVGVESFPVSGYCYEAEQSEFDIKQMNTLSIGHAWNMVKIGGKWGHVDVTWDDSGDSHSYFGVSDTFMQFHERTFENEKKCFYVRIWGSMHTPLKNNRVMDESVVLGVWQLEELWETPAEGWSNN